MWNTSTKMCIRDSDNGVIGACNFRDAEYRRVRILKEAGFNAIRSSHNPISREMLEACDEIGTVSYTHLICGMEDKSSILEKWKSF